jgi:hypothetical protein
LRSWSLALVALVIVVSVACQHDPPVAPRPGGTTADSGAPTSVGNILAAEKAGKIDHDTALVSMVLAVYAPERLPADLAGPPPKVGLEATGLFAEISRRSSKMTPALQGVVKPFFLRPTDPASFWNHEAPKHGEDSPDPTPACKQSHIDDPRYPIRYWYCKDTSSGFLNMRAMMAAVDAAGVYDTEKQIMLGNVPLSDDEVSGDNGGSGSLDIYYVPAGSSAHGSGYRSETTNGASGVTIPQGASNGDGPTPVYVIINDDQDGAFLNRTFAHELFHAFQYSFPGATTIDWWSEASARWAEDHVFPQENTCLYSPTSLWRTEPAGSGKVADSIDGPLTYWKQLAPQQYAACLWPFYLTNVDSNPPTIVGQIWKARGPGISTLTAMQTVIPNFNDKFKTFALVNWNADVSEATKYKLADGSTFEDMIQAPSVVTVSKPDPSKDDTSSSITVNVPHASVQYVRVSVSDVGAGGATYVPQLDFDLSGIDFKKVSVQAIANVTASGGGLSHVYQDWQGATQEKFCRDQADQNIQSVVLIIANPGAEASDDYNAKINLKATSACAPAATGNFTYSASSNIQHGQDPDCVKQRKAFDDGLTSKGSVHQTTVTGSTTYSESVTSQWKLALLEDITNPATKERTVIYEIDSNTQISLQGGGSYEDKLYQKIVAPDGKLIGEGTKDSQTSFNNMATGKVCNGMPPAAASGGGASWSCPPGFAPAYGQPWGHGGLPGRLTLHIAANGDAKYQLGWSADSVPMQSKCQTSTTETSSGGHNHSSSMSYTPGSGSTPGSMVYTSSDGKGNTVPQKGVPAAFSPNQTQSGVAFWSGPFSGGKSGGDIDASSTIDNSECKPPGVMGLYSAPCDFSMGDTCDTCSYKATMHLHIHVDIPQQASSPTPAPAAAPGADPCTQLAACCAALPTVAQQIAAPCNMLAGMKQAPACTNMLTTLRGKNLCP